MRPVLARCLSVLSLVAIVLVAPTAGAEDSVDRAAKQLRNSEDFRVRTQAALSLGSSKSKRAVEPLCDGLEDSNTTVRIAAAAALGKLKKGGKDCLEKRLEDENSGAVKKSIKKALTQIGSGGAGPAITSSTKVYVAIAKVSDKTGRSGNSVGSIVRKSMLKAAGGLDGFVVAPEDETTTQAKKVLSKWKKLKAFYLSPKVLAPKYSGGSLQVKVEVAIFTYPGKALKGNIPVKLTQQGVSGEDTDSEDELIKMASERVMEKFSQNVERIE